MSFNPVSNLQKRAKRAVDFIGLPADPQLRKQCPVFSGFIKYFPLAIVEVSKVSWIGNEQHNPGQELHWARGKSTDQEDTLLRHMIDPLLPNSGKFDTDGVRHAAKAAWRAMARLQIELEKDLEEQNKAGDLSSGDYACLTYTCG